MESIWSKVVIYVSISHKWQDSIDLSDKTMSHDTFLKLSDEDFGRIARQDVLTMLRALNAPWDRLRFQIRRKHRESGLVAYTVVGVEREELFDTPDNVFGLLLRSRAMRRLDRLGSPPLNLKIDKS